MCFLQWMPSDNIFLWDMLYCYYNCMGNLMIKALSANQPNSFYIVITIEIFKDYFPFLNKLYDITWFGAVYA